MSSAADESWQRAALQDTCDDAGATPPVGSSAASSDAHPPPHPPVSLFVPGRICLLGEHSDWAGGYRRFNSLLPPGACLVSGTSQGLYASVRLHPTHLVLSSADATGHREPPLSIPMEAGALLAAAAAGGHYSYMAGTAYQILTRYHVQGLVVDNYKTDLPARKGLSSSAAASVLVARAFNRAYDLKLTVRGEMDLAYNGEITTPSQCGRMDQCCAFGARPVLMTFDGDRLECEPLKLGCTLHLVIVELAGRKDTTEILQKLSKCYPVADDEAQRGVQRLLGEENQRIIGAAMRALGEGDMPALGALMDEAQELFDHHAIPVCPSQLTAPNLHRVLRHAPLRAHIWGAKGVGSQGDGCAQLLCRSEADMVAAMQLVERDLGMVCMPLRVGAARPVRTALIPAASFSSSLYPASRSLAGGALFPILDADGILKPAVLLLVEEALEAGLERVVIVVSAAHRRDFDELFHQHPDVRELHRLPPRLQQYASKITDMGAKVELVVQHETLGLGHAVLVAEGALSADEPVLLMLGDHIYRSHSAAGRSCVGQLLDAYRGVPLMALQRTPEASVAQYGCATGKWDNSGGGGQAAPVPLSRLSITSLVEKPTTEFARANLKTPGLPPDTYLTAFGLYILTEVGTVLESLRAKATASAAAAGGGGEATKVGFTPELDALRRQRGLEGVLLEGVRYDVGGEPESWLNALDLRR